METKKRYDRMFPCFIPQEKAPEFQSVATIEFPNCITSSQERVINPLNDRRLKVSATKEWPFCAHGVISWTKNGASITGSGTLIGPDLDSSSAPVESIAFHPGADGYHNPFGVYKVEKYFIPDDYLKNNNEDYAVLKLSNTKIGNTIGYFGLCNGEEEVSSLINDQTDVYIYGYPYDKIQKNPRRREMWGHEGKILEMTENKVVYYDIDTNPGQSGSAVYKINKDNKCFVIAVHCRGSIN